MASVRKRVSGLTNRVEQLLRGDIAQRRPGDQLPTERELSQRFDVSIAKVREALTLLDREGLIERSHGRGTFVCEPRVRKWVAVVLKHDLAHPRLSFYERCLYQSIRQQLESAGVTASGYCGFESPDSHGPLHCPEFFRDLDADRIRHVVPVGGELSPALTADLKSRGIGLTVTNQARNRKRMHDMLRLGVRYLAEEGRRHVALLAWVDPRRLSPAVLPGNNDWDSVFRAEAQAAGLSIRPEWVRCDLHPSLTGAGWQEFRDLWRSRAQKPDGLLICNDTLARDAAIAIVEMGISVPASLLVVTHENCGSDQWFPFPVARLQVDPEQDAAILAREVMGALGVEADVHPAGPECRLVPLAACGPKRLAATEDLVAGREQNVFQQAVK